MYGSGSSGVGQPITVNISDGAYLRGNLSAGTQQYPDPANPGSYLYGINPNININITGSGTVLEGQVNIGQGSLRLEQGARIIAPAQSTYSQIGTSGGKSSFIITDPGTTATFAGPTDYGYGFTVGYSNSSEQAVVQVLNGASLSASPRFR